MRIKNYKRKQAGFTLIEIMVVVVILAILGAAVVPKLIGNVDEANITRAKHDITTLESLLDQYRLKNSTYPSDEQGLEALVSKPSGSPEPRNWSKLLKELPKDPWGEDYIYEVDGDDITIISYGADLQEGGEGTAADITNKSSSSE